MIKMSESSRSFLEKNCPSALEAKNLHDLLEILNQDMTLKGFDASRGDELNSYGREEERVYDDIFYSNVT